MTALANSDIKSLYVLPTLVTLELCNSLPFSSFSSNQMLSLDAFHLPIQLILNQFFQFAGNCQDNCVLVKY